MELRLQQFIESVETLADIRNLDTFNPIVFQLEHPVTATRYTIVGSKTEPSYLGVPVNTTWVVLDPQSPYYRIALKLVQTNNPDRSTTFPPIVAPDNSFTLYWNLLNAYEEIFADPQYYVGGTTGPQGPQGPQGPAGEVDYNLAVATLASLTGELSINGAASVDANGTSQYTLILTEAQVLANGTITDPQPRQVAAQITLVGAVPAGTYVDTSNVLHVGALPAGNANISLFASYPSWAKAAIAYKEVQLQTASASVTAVIMTGPDTVNSGTQAQYQVSVQWSDNTITNPSATWQLDSTNYGSISSNGMLTVPGNIAGSGSVNVSATLVIGGITYTPNKTIIVNKVAEPATVTAVEVQGDISVDSGTSSQYAILVRWSDNTTTSPAATWATNTNQFGTINANSGMLTVPSDIVSSGNVTITGTVTVNGTTYQPTLVVAVTKIVVVLTVQSVTISGPGTINNGSNANYVLDVLWSNNSVTHPVASSWSTDVPDFGTISSSGLLAVPSNLATGGNVTVNASVTINGTNYTPSKAVSVVIVDVSTIAPFYGIGPALPADWQGFVTGLTQFPALTVDGKYDVSIDALGSTSYMYFAYPMSHGEATFYDKLSQFFGGWGGAGNPSAGPSSSSQTNFKDMPITQNITIGGASIPFYIYRTDFANLGAAAANQWEITLTTP